jgi:hypothetical protein
MQPEAAHIPHKTKVPVAFHNLRGYDGHLLMQAIGKIKTMSLAWKKDKTGKWVQVEKTDTIGCIPNNMEKYMTFSLGQLQFIVSLQFMNSLLDKLVANTSELWMAKCSGCQKTVEIKDGGIAREGDRYCVIWPMWKLQGKCVEKNSVEHAEDPVSTELSSAAPEGQECASTYLCAKESTRTNMTTASSVFDETQLPPKEAFYSRLSREHHRRGLPARAARLGGVRLQDVR